VKSFSLQKIPVQLILLKEVILFLVCMSLLQSCAWITSKRSLFGDDEEEAKNSSPAMVPKSQYDQLLSKYQGLVKEGRQGNRESIQAEEISKKDPSQIIEELGQVKNTGELAETVDVFDRTGNSSSPNSQQRGARSLSLGKGGSQYSPELVEDHIAKIRKIESLVAQNKLEASLNLLKEVENSPIRQVAVRAKFFLGEIMFIQGEYDLSMQVYEEIIHKHAFSGLVLKTLGRLIVCSEKLKLESKRGEYYSVLHDFFEEKS
jgi:TolA-binding protein